MVPSPPKVAVRSTFWARKEDRDTPLQMALVSRGIV